METFVCRQTLTGHKDDVLSISGLPPPTPSLPSHAHAPHEMTNGHHASMDEKYREVRLQYAMQCTAMLMKLAWTCKCLCFLLIKGILLQLRPALSGMDGAALIISSSADATVRLWRSKCWSCLRIFTIAPGTTPSTSLPFLSTALSPE